MSSLPSTASATSSPTTATTTTPPCGARLKPTPFHSFIALMPTPPRVFRSSPAPLDSPPDAPSRQLLREWAEAQGLESPSRDNQELAVDGAMQLDDEVKAGEGRGGGGRVIAVKQPAKRKEPKEQKSRRGPRAGVRKKTTTRKARARSEKA